MRAVLRLFPGCLNVATIDLQEIKAILVLFDHGVLARLRLDLPALEQFNSKCDNKLLPLGFHQHESSKGLTAKAVLNLNGECDAPNTGGHHDPGFACGKTGGVSCKNLNIPPSS